MKAMRPILTTAICLVLTLVGIGEPLAPNQSFMMRESQDAKSIQDVFEIWTVTGNLGGPQATCTIQVASLTVLNDQTYIHNWIHYSEKISEIQSGIFKVEMTGRLNEFSGLEVVIELSADRKRIINVSGSMRAGTKGQSVSVFQVDRDTKTRKIPPVFNPSWSAAPVGEPN